MWNFTRIIISNAHIMLHVSQFYQVAIVQSVRCGESLWKQVNYVMLSSRKTKASKEQLISQEVASTTFWMACANSSRQGNCLATSGNKKTLAACLSTHLDRSKTSNQAKQMDRNPQHHKACQREQCTEETNHNCQISSASARWQPLHKRSCISSGAQQQLASASKTTTVVNSVLQSCSPILTKRLSEGSKVR